MNLLVRRAGRVLPMAGPPLDGPSAVLVREGRVDWVGPDRELPAGLPELPELDAGGACVTPGFVDAHTHLVWAGSRRAEFTARLGGTAYDGGGIRTTVAATRAASTEDLLALAAGRAAAALRNGTTTMEVKTGYGLAPDEELRLLEVLRRLADAVPLRIEPTYLGAHVVPEGRSAADYVAEVIATLPAAREAGARWCDVFCDRGAFSVPDTRRILEAARAAGLGLRLHAEELAHTGAAGLAAALGCASADHLEHVTPADASAMAAAGTVGVLLPSVTLSLRGDARGHARVLREAGVTLALATDCNPGTSWCESMPYVIQLGCLLLGLSVAEAFLAATRGGAAALRRDDLGRLSPGARGDLVVLDAEHEADMVAHLGAPAVRHVVAGGELLAGAAAG